MREVRRGERQGGTEHRTTASVGRRWIACGASVLIVLGVWACWEFRPARGTAPAESLVNNALRDACEPAADTPRGFGEVQTSSVPNKSVALPAPSREPTPTGHAEKPGKAQPAKDEAEQAPPSWKSTDLTPEMKRVCPALEIDCDTEIASIERMPTPNLHLTSVTTVEGQELVFDRDGTLRRYMLGEQLGTPEGLRRKDGIALRDATKLANAMLAKVGVPFAFSESDGQYRNGSSDEDTLDGYTHWSFTRQQEYAGFAYAFSRVSVDVRAYDGKISHLSNGMTTECPASIEERVSADEAVETAEEFAWKMFPCLEGTPAREDVGEMITYPNTWPSLQNPPPQPSPDAECPELRLCWIVRFGEPGDYWKVVFVDTGTGKVIGGI